MKDSENKNTVLNMTTEMRIEQILARNIKAEAVRYGLTIEDLENVLGKGKTALHARLNGTVEFRPSEMQRLADAMGIEVADFFKTQGKDRSH